MFENAAEPGRDLGDCVIRFTTDDGSRRFHIRANAGGDGIIVRVLSETISDRINVWPESVNMIQLT